MFPFKIAQQAEADWWGASLKPFCDNPIQSDNIIHEQQTSSQ